MIGQWIFMDVTSEFKNFITTYCDLAFFFFLWIYKKIKAFPGYVGFKKLILLYSNLSILINNFFFFFNFSKRRGTKWLQRAPLCARIWLILTVDIWIIFKKKKMFPFYQHISFFLEQNIFKYKFVGLNSGGGGRI